MAFLLGVRSPSLASLSSQPHQTLYSGQAEALAGLLAELDGAPVGISYGRTMLLDGLASGVAAAWSCAKGKPKKQPGSSVVAGVQLHPQVQRVTLCLPQQMTDRCAVHSVLVFSSWAISCWECIRTHSDKAGSLVQLPSRWCLALCFTFRIKSNELCDCTTKSLTARSN